eukprot:EST44578.1 Myb-like DNA-binding domain-containing protein [Spironucleus salmonicida]
MDEEIQRLLFQLNFRISGYMEAFVLSQDLDVTFQEYKRSLTDIHLLNIAVPENLAFSSTALRSSSNSAGSVKPQTVIVSKKFWSTEENYVLQISKQQNSQRTWQEISEFVKTKNAKQCCQQWHRVILAKKKGRWTELEDEELLSQSSYGTIAIEGRSQLQIANRLKLLQSKNKN